MKFVCFHLMPYRPLDLEAAKNYRSAWVVLPNSFYDPEKGAAEYDSYLDQLTYAEELGFDVIGVNEHHQTAYGLMPAPNLIASALIKRTKKVQSPCSGARYRWSATRSTSPRNSPCSTCCRRGGLSPASCAASARNITRPGSIRRSRMNAFMKRTI
jgi:hypothetical protein